MNDLYSIIQFYPRALRREGVNVGVVVVSERLGVTCVKMSSNNELIKQHIGAAGFEDAWLGSAKRSLARRLQDLQPSQSALFEFIAKEAGQLVVLPPRPISMEDPKHMVSMLFEELVGEVEPQRRPREQAPKLDDIFMPLFAGKLVEKVPSVQVPVVGRQLHSVYRYRNGVLNYIKAQAFPAGDDAAMKLASNLGLLGLMFAKHPLRDDRQELEQRFIVIAKLGQRALARRIATVLGDCSVRLVPLEKVTGFVEEVRKSAHELH